MQSRPAPHNTPCSCTSPAAPPSLQLVLLHTFVFRDTGEGDDDDEDGEDDDDDEDEDLDADLDDDLLAGAGDSGEGDEDDDDEEEDDDDGDDEEGGEARRRSGAQAGPMDPADKAAAKGASFAKAFHKLLEGKAKGGAEEAPILAVGALGWEREGRTGPHRTTAAVCGAV